MKFGATMMAAVLLSCSLAMAQVCPPSPGTVCLVPSPSAASTTTGVISTATSPSIFYVTPVASVPTATGFPVYVMTASGLVPISSFPGCPNITSVSGIPSTSITSAYPSISATPTDACLAQLAALQNEVRTVRAQVLSSALEMRGQALIDRMNNLMMAEQAFRQQLAANPNLPGAQGIAQLLQQQAATLNSDIIAFQRQVAVIPADLRPLVASSLNTFDVVYWSPAMQRFIAYSTQFPQAVVTYQPLFATNPWLAGWVAGYQASLSGIAMVSPTVIASLSGVTPMPVPVPMTVPTVAGTMETFPSGGTVMMLPSGAAIYFPPGSVPMMGTTTTPVAVVPPTTTTTPPATTTTPPATTTTPPATTTTPPATTTTPTGTTTY